MSTNSTEAETGRGRGQLALLALLIGFVLGIMVMFLFTGNPFSSANEVSYMDVTVASIGESDDSLCWSSDPDDRDAPQECAILALDPQQQQPAVGDMVSIGIVEIAPPGQETRTQIVHTAPPQSSPDDSSS